MHGATIGLAAAVLLALPVHAECRIARVASVPLTLADNRAIVDVSMNENPGKFELDTGAGSTILDPIYARSSHVGMDRHAGQMDIEGAGGQQTLPIWTAHVRQTEIGELKFPDWEYPVITQPIPSPVHIDGLLGADFLHYFDIELDIPAGRMSLWRLFGCTELRPAWPGAYDAIDLKPTKGQQLSIPIWIDNAFLDVLFDTGAGNLLLTRDAANRAGATDADIDRDQTSQFMGLGGAFAASHHAFQTLLVGSGVFNHPVIAIDSHPSRAGGDAYAGRDGLLGLGLLKADRIWISFGTGTLFLQSPKQAQSKPN